MNVYRWDNPESIFTDWAAVSTKPMYLSESGADTYNNLTGKVDEDGAATAINNIWQDVNAAKNICSGITFFEFIDKWWKAAGSSSEQGIGGNAIGVPFDGFGNQEYFGIVDIDRNEKKGYKKLKEVYCLATGNVQEMNLNNSFELYPNPTKENVQINFNHNTQEQGSIAILDIYSNVVFIKDITTINGYNIMDLNIGDLNSGMYVVQIKVGEIVLREKLEVIR
jgi:hypothetical protein